jgi:SAM-dependent methyltransferase
MAPARDRGALDAPVAPSTRRTVRPSPDDFAGRAAAEATGRDAAVLELGPTPGAHGRHFDPARYRWLGPPAAAGARQPSVTRLPLGDEQFGFVLCVEAVAEHPDPQGLLTEVNRVLEPHGRLFLAAPLIVPDASQGHLPWRSRFGLNYLLEASGFTIEELQALERTRSYGIVAAKRHRPGHHPRGGATVGQTAAVRRPPTGNARR